jgi:hypothetical protein
MRREAGALGVGLLLLAGRVQAQDRPPEDEMFGGAGESHRPRPPPTADASHDHGHGHDHDRTATTTTTTTETTATPGPAPKSIRAIALNLGDPKAGTRFSAEVAPKIRLKIGGQFYWRVMSSGKQGQYPQNWSLSAPALLDVFMDARPNDRVRAFVLGRMSYDPTLAPNGTTSTGTGGVSAGAAQGNDSLSAMFGQATRGPECGARSDVAALRSLAHGVRDRRASSTCAGEPRASGPRPTTCTCRHATPYCPSTRAPARPC